MDVNVKAGVPVVPPSTYDITGLTRDEAVFLRDLLGIMSAHWKTSEPEHFHSKLYNRLANVLPGCRENDFTASVGSEGGEGEINVIHHAPHNA